MRQYLCRYLTQRKATSHIVEDLPERQVPPPPLVDPTSALLTEPATDATDEQEGKNPDIKRLRSRWVQLIERKSSDMLSTMTVIIPLEIVIKILTLATRRRKDAASWIRLCRHTYTLFERLLYTKVVLLDDNHASKFVKCYHLRQAHSESLRPTTAMFIGNGTKSSMVMANTFAKLTHLEIDDPGLLCRLDMGAFHQLTHLALWTDLSDHRLLLPRLVNRLLQLATLKVLIFRAWGHRSCARSLEYYGLLDPRIVIGPSKVYVWDHFGQGSMLLWELADERTNIPGPNHRKHRCFSNSTYENRFRDFMALPRVPERDVDRELVQCFVVGRLLDGTRETIWRRNDSSDDSSEEELADDDKEEDSADHNSPSDDAEEGSYIDVT
ncbi:hypothetical protein DFJ58DRAFT_848435 [Suillus subalutaceus]|uniref:uncharacterized protein n=1 Tax=Suillus subalutaceus TaxID=48586 RepID=UPI001B86CA1D|nr:uncharacterized protein DFJ58DRAFT_848435 [Suillus subalutaceus]KAG1830503.1 hypothetical protein DFJ58DRAFT_848435 [Suillus subalutaceus]